MTSQSSQACEKDAEKSEQMRYCCGAGVTWCNQMRSDSSPRACVRVKVYVVQIEESEAGKLYEQMLEHNMVKCSCPGGKQAVH